MDRDVVERVRRAVYDTFASHGRVPGTRRIGELAAVGEAEVKEAVAELAARRQLALDRSGNIVMAHPSRP